ncbi:MAG: hypothetical protein GWM92_14610, partial [Gemmatimonadetes bacterium]|nr:hypothetical protein [Gemmatimonadota bacterium]NIT88698.1 hypothetical protein [Gemmatimonadota bacterium]NIU73501.1 hypothetical protein [Gammaproteobacteria bacterium]NIY07910.1 hypothetical protein [Gemmatimonadota bacterium]NIY40617.1 hypothetical protein [Gemmatimonadota bacterium]
VDVVLAQEALALAEALEDPWLGARGRMMLGVSLTFDGRPDEAMGMLRSAAEVYAELGD